MEEMIELLSETLLWENISEYVEANVQASEVLKDVEYIDGDIIKKIEKIEILDSDGFIIKGFVKQNDKYCISFQMPIVFMFSNNQEQVLRVTTNVIGTCIIDDENHYNWNQHDFDNMTRLELLSCKDLVQNIQCGYQNTECDDLRAI